MRLEMSFRYRLSGHSERVYDAPSEFMMPRGRTGLQGRDLRCKDRRDLRP